MPDDDLPEDLNAGQEADDWITIARIARPQGIRGEVIADLLTDFPERFANLETAQVKKASGDLLNLQLESHRPHKGRILLKFAGYDTMNAAESLRDARVVITKDQLVKLPEDSYYEFDLVGCDVVTISGGTVGRVTGVRHFGAAPLLAVGSGEREHLIPLVSSICLEVDIANKRVVIDPPEGLLEL
ncbi:MAG: ribosome maturation factor RimM [Acidobacteriota bacterium]|nr:ribosome maturation factor RimM [Acidobacteriota bacterium]